MKSLIWFGQFRTRITNNIRGSGRFVPQRYYRWLRQDSFYTLLMFAAIRRYVLLRVYLNHWNELEFYKLTKYSFFFRIFHILKLNVVYIQHVCLKYDSSSHRAIRSIPLIDPQYLFALFFCHKWDFSIMAFLRRPRNWIFLEFRHHHVTRFTSSRDW